MNWEERIVAGSYFISAEDGGEDQTIIRETLTMEDGLTIIRETLTMLNVCSTENDDIQV